MNSQSLQALILQELMDAARTGGAVNSSDLAAKYHSTNVRRRIKELGDDYGILYRHDPTPFFRDPFTARRRRKGDEYRLTESPKSALEKYELGPRQPPREGRRTAQGDGFDQRPLRNAPQAPVVDIQDPQREAILTHQAASLLGKRSGVKRQERSKAMGPGKETWAEHNKRRKESQTSCLI